MQQLQQSVEEARPLVDALNKNSQQLANLSPGDGAAKMDETIAKDSKKFSVIADQVQKRVEKIKLKRHKSQEVGKNESLRFVFVIYSPATESSKTLVHF